MLYSSKGLYPIKSFPQLSGNEASGTVVGLPTNESVLNHEYYKLRGLQLGSKVAAVRLGLGCDFISICHQANHLNV